MVIFLLSEITDAGLALQMAKDLVVAAIDAAGATRGRSKKIKLVESRIKKLVSLCRAMVVQNEKGDWRKPVYVMQASIEHLEEARNEERISTWNI